MRINLEDITKYLLDRKYIAIAIIFLVIIFGIWSFNKIDIEAYPDFSPPKVQIITQMSGKSAEDVERLVTIPIEKECNGLPGKERMYSTTIFGLSVIEVVFKDGSPSSLIRQQVLERLYQVNLPQDVKPLLGPDTSAIGEIYRYTIESKYHSLMNLKSTENWQIERMFKQIPDIIDVTSFGGPVKTYKVILDMQKVRFYDVNIGDIYDSILHSNSTTGGHYVDINSQAFIVRGLGLLDGVKSIENVVIQEKNGVPVRVRDVAQVVLEPAMRLGQVGKNGQDDVIEGIVLMRKGANPTKTMKALNKAIPNIQANLPKGVKIVPLYKRQQLVERTLDTIGHNMFLGISFVIIILLAYTLNLRLTLIASCVIPLCILFAFILFDIFDIPVNILSLGAVDFGVIVDGAIIITENIYRHLKSIRGEITEDARKSAIIKATKEVAPTIVFATFIIWGCFLPFFAFDGVAAKLFHPHTYIMGFTLLGAALASLFIVPSLSLIFFPPKIEDKDNKYVDKFIKKYKKILKICLRKPKKLFNTIILTFALAVLLLTQIGSEFIPSLDEGNIWIRVTVLPRSTTIENAVEIAKNVRKAIKEYPEVKNVASHIGSPDDGTDHNLLSNIEVLVDLELAKNWRRKFHRNKENLVNDMSERLSQIPGIHTYFTQYIQDNVEESIAGAKGQVALKIYGSDLKELQRLQNEALVTMHTVRGVVDIMADKPIGQPQYQIIIDREKAARYGINSDDIQNVVEIGIGGKNATQVIEGEKRFNVVVRMEKADRETKGKFENILIKTPDGTFIPIKSIAEIVQKEGAMFINRMNNERCALIRFNIRNRDLGSTINDAKNKIKQGVVLPAEYHIEWAGQTDCQQRANKRLMIILPITLLVIGGLLRLAFKDWQYVGMSMSVVILAFMGSIFALFLTGTYFSVSAGVGFIAAIGVCIQNAVILLMELHRTGERFKCSPLRRCKTLLTASVIKLKPILMASSVAIIGLVPAAVSNDIGAQNQKPFAIAIIGALIVGTAFSIFLMPVLFNVVKLEREAHSFGEKI